jgi:hypothetical protein
LRGISHDARPTSQRLRSHDFRPCEAKAEEDLERVPPCRFRVQRLLKAQSARVENSRSFGDLVLASFTLSPSLHVQAPSMVPTHASFGLMRTAFPTAAEATTGALRQDESDRCLPTVTAVTCTRISRASRGMLIRAALSSDPPCLTVFGHGETRPSRV